MISSTAAWYPTPRMSFYNVRHQRSFHFSECHGFMEVIITVMMFQASKAAMVSFFETLRAEFGADIGITIVTPGMIKSEMTDDEFLSKVPF